MNRKPYFSISTFALINEPLTEALDWLIREGWTRIELMCEDGHRELLDWSDERLDELKRRGVRDNVRWTLHAPIFTLNPCAVDEGERRSSQAVLHRAMDIAERLDCAYVVLHAGMGEGERDGPEALDRCVSFLTEVLAARRPSPLKLALENVPPKPKLHGVSPEFVKSVVERVGHPRLGILFDAGHAHVLGPDACLAGLRLCLPHLIGMHLNDNQGDYDSHLAVGMGTIPYAELVATVMRHGFRGSWVIETESPTYAEQSVERLTALRDGFIG
ncbi:sugar phosphate isomerase/epimerase [Cohnella sp. LGH]|uniref:sugar phosphate isomerase/epimerase family protein n=1 Tax=Cohnella sp. LGH TaxID=1619153 RepID=UPI001ADC81DC|nr:sugar phosphate isomerase/epimerase family protein [Cohnella sp. LGH]QTH44246.1 sugar phosphate isomerase/epimerase [Cohnella sp. LGH]